MELSLEKKKIPESEKKREKKEFVIYIFMIRDAALNTKMGITAWVR